MTPPAEATMADRIQEILLQQRVNKLLDDWLTALRAQGTRAHAEARRGGAMSTDEKLPDAAAAGAKTPVPAARRAEHRRQEAQHGIPHEPGDGVADRRRAGAGDCGGGRFCVVHDDGGLPGARGQGDRVGAGGRDRRAGGGARRCTSACGTWRSRWMGW